MTLILTFWTLWALTALAAGTQVFRPIVTTQGLLGFPFVAGLAWLYFYVYMAFDVAISLRDYVPIEALCLAQFVALICFLGLVFGWNSALRKGGRIRNQYDHNRYPANRLWNGGMLALVIGCIGQYTFMAQETVDWSNTTAYWHMLFNIGYPGAALCIAAVLRMPPQQRRSRYLTLGVAVTALLYPFLLYARRGPLFPGVIMLTFAPILFSGKRPKRAVVMGALGGCGALMLLFIAIRPFIYAGEVENLSGGWSVAPGAMSGGWQAGLSDLSASAVLAGKGAYLGDNEFAYHCGAVWTLYKTGMYQYGTGDLTLLTHWIPRQVWEDKPGLEVGFFPSVIPQIKNVMGWQMTYGASWGGVASVFEQYGFLSPLFWAALGYFAGHAYRRALSHCLRKEMTYLGFLSGTHWLVSQGFGAAFVPMCIFIIPAVVFLRLVRVNPSPELARDLPSRLAIAKRLGMATPAVLGHPPATAGE
jgi:hypothetical protein